MTGKTLFISFSSTIFFYFCSTHAVIVQEETLESPDGTFTLNAGGDYHLANLGKENSKEWQQVNDYIEQRNPKGEVALEDNHSSSVLSSKALMNSL